MPLGQATCGPLSNNRLHCVTILSSDSYMAAKTSKPTTKFYTVATIQYSVKGASINFSAPNSLGRGPCPISVKE